MKRHCMNKKTKLKITFTPADVHVRRIRCSGRISQVLQKISFQT